MKFFSIFCIIYCYIISQTHIDARATGLSKSYWPLSTNGDYQDDVLHQKFESKRQAGWGKRRDLMTDYDDTDFPPYHPFASLRHSARTWFDYE
ncbi:unnamed protein product [Adineta ricciae]|uniref:Uncharacterized protein n=1 Tax=Adineta ricciae TaxID=249248 RepID=A0A813UTL8_ADIRI|nr:unnamed protein product [Adineta ricciae]CAF0988271.1 unnamed protein product [Adineta ricciae]